MTVAPNTQCRLCSAILDYRAGDKAQVESFRKSWEYLTKDDKLEAMQRAVRQYFLSG